MKTLIIGGTGKISTSITREILANGDEVVLYNRGQTANRIDGDVEIITGDRNDQPRFEGQIQDAGPFDCVIDMICFTPEQAESTIRACKGATNQLIFCSTVNVYTKPAKDYPQAEDAERNNVIDNYGVNKSRCEDMFMAAHERGDFAVTNMRPAHTYADIGHVVHTFGVSTALLDRIRKGKPIIIHGDGTSFWGACHSDDVGHAFVQAIGNEVAYGKAYNVTSMEALMFNDYYDTVGRVMDASPIEKVYIPSDLLGRIAPERAHITTKNLFGHNLFDNSAAQRDLGFNYTITWQEGVARMLAWMETHDGFADSDSPEEAYYDRIIQKWQAVSDEMAGVLAD